MVFWQDDVFLDMPDPKTDAFASFLLVLAIFCPQKQLLGHFDELTQIALTRQYAVLDKVSS